ncbi:hypothetical protein Bca101_069759 [Brassica carinata]
MYKMRDFHAHRHAPFRLKPVRGNKFVKLNPAQKLLQLKKFPWLVVRNRHEKHSQDYR